MERGRKWRVSSGEGCEGKLTEMERIGSGRKGERRETSCRGLEEDKTTLEGYAREAERTDVRREDTEENSPGQGRARQVKG
jgi:hypothetical protein